MAHLVERGRWGEEGAGSWLFHYPPLPCSPEQAGSWLGITLSKSQVDHYLARQAPFLWLGQMYCALTEYWAPRLSLTGVLNSVRLTFLRLPWAAPGKVYL